MGKVVRCRQGPWDFAEGVVLEKRFPDDVVLKSRDME